jgi:PEP-CTERM motif
MQWIRTCQSAVSLLLVLFVLLTAIPSWAVPVTGYLEATALSGWQGDFAVRLSDSTIVSGVQQMAGGFTTLSTLPLITTGCEFGTSCGLVTNVSTSSTVTMSNLFLALEGSSTLGSLGTVSWGAQLVRLLPGDPSPTAAVLAIASGTLGGTTLAKSSFSFGFNSTLTTFYSAVNGGQRLSGLRLDFTDGIAPPTSRALLDQAPTVDGKPGFPVFVNNGVPVSLGTTLSSQSVPEPSMLPLMTLSLAGLIAWHRGRASH